MHEKHSPPAKLNPTVLCNGSVCGGGFSQRWKPCSGLGERRFWGGSWLVWVGGGGAGPAGARGREEDEVVDTEEVVDISLGF